MGAHRRAALECLGARRTKTEQIVKAQSTQTASGDLLGAEYRVPDEQRPDEHRPHDQQLDEAGREEEYHSLIHRLSRQSVVKHFDAYADVEWDNPEFRIDPDDPRWQLDPDDVLGATSWYQAQPASTRSRIGLHMQANFFKLGVIFESVLKQGLLEFAARLPNRSAEFRYCYHEMIEEAQHSLMFQEFVNRSAFDIPGLNRIERAGANMVVRMARRFPELFFVFVLAGEDPIDHVQRQILHRNRGDIHPLLRRIMQIHVTEEARHLSFARHFLRRHVPLLSPVRRLQLMVRAPLIFSGMGRLMMEASPSIMRAYGIPKEVSQQAYKLNPVHRERTLGATEKLRGICSELRLINHWSWRLWRIQGIWPASAPPPLPA
jgi:hypothetical protein